jgi:hypothetical protein
MQSVQAGRERGSREIVSWLRVPLRGVLALMLSLAALLPAALLWIPASPARADSQPLGRAFRCDGEPLSALLVPGAVDASDIPNTLAGTLPGAYMVLRWRGVQLQLPRSNNAGAPSFSDGKWAWSEAEADHPVLRLRRPGGDLQDFACEAISPPLSPTRW